MVDTDQTPRVSKASASKGPATSAPSLSSSQSDAAYSHDSKRSRRSQSPSKLFPLYGPDGHRLVRGSLILGCEQTRYDSRSGEELVRRASRIAVRSSDCSRMLSDESAWNNLVHSPLLDMLLYDMRDGPGQEILDFIPCIDPAYHRFPDAASRIDYVLQLLPERDPDINKSYEALALGMAPCFNCTADRLLQQYPLAVSIETKRYGGNAAKGEQQLGIWHASHWDFLASRVSAEAIGDLGFLSRRCGPGSHLVTCHYCEASGYNDSTV
ncbi:unnamed protein product [Clonostachys byssicola]|uniref:PD-(D/E)XK nuclease-like domain-containing protein n=1 Tax=Clonostachys byssicola TaxID=160290 RepID=A0A9N9UAC6_9HYPO|nr:unnamed protein product [Clonostachys byssicola]